MTASARAGQGAGAVGEVVERFELSLEDEMAAVRSEEELDRLEELDEMKSQFEREKTQRSRERRPTKISESVNRGRPLVCETFSVPRVTDKAKRMGHALGWALDIAGADEYTGRTWDLRQKRAQDEAMRLLHRTKPYLLILSPPCTLFSQMQRRNINRGSPA